LIRENDELRPREAERRGGFGSQRVGSGRILLRQASSRRKIASNEPGIRGMSARTTKGVTMRTGVLSLSIVAAIAATPAWAGMMGRGAGEPLEQSRCRIIEEAARANLLPVGLLTRLLWTESHFQADALSPKGARGVAQFMPGTADERGLSDPFDPAEAIPQAARLLADLDRRFENTGLAIAAYNAGSKRVSDWLASTGSLPNETQKFVLAVTGRSPAEWGAIRGYRLPADTQSCLALSTSLAAYPFKHARQAYPGYSSPYGNSDGLRESSGRNSQYYIGYHKPGSHHPYGSNSQYYIGYREPDRSRDPYGLNSQYYIGYRNSDGSNRDGS
jgi:hypothetical protein